MDSKRYCVWKYNQKTKDSGNHERVSPPDVFSFGMVLHTIVSHGGMCFRALAAAALTLSVSILHAQAPLEESIYFYNDYDTPLRVNNQFYPLELEENGYVPGASGNGYYYRLPGYNWYEKKTADASDPEAFQNVPLRRVTEETVSVSDMMTELEDEGGLPEAKKEEKDPKKLHPDKTVKANPDALVIRNGTVTVKEGTLCVKPATVSTNVNWRTGYSDIVTGSAWVKGKAGAVLRAEVAPTAFPDTMEAARAEWTRFHKSENPNTKKIPPFLPDEFSPREVKLTGDWQRIAAYVSFDCRLNKRQIAFNLETKDRSAFEAKQFQLEVRPVSIPEPADWMPGKTRIYGNAFTITNPELLSAFPEKEGALFYRVKFKDHPTNLPETFSPIFTCGEFIAEPAAFNWWPVKRLEADGIRRNDANTWHSVAVTWDADSVRIYQDGKLRGSRVRPKGASEKKKTELSLGHSKRPGGSESNVVLDDVIVFNRWLGAQEIQSLSERTTALMSGRKEALGEGIYGTVFYRNENPAQLTFGIFASEEMKGTLTYTIGEEKFSAVTVTLNKGENLLRAPFEAWKFEPGKYPYELNLSFPDGTKEFRSRGTLEILPGKHTSEFKFMNWGGMDPIENDYLRFLGINTALFNATTGDAEPILRAGLYLSPRHENSGVFTKWNYNKEKIAESDFRALRKFAGYAGWVMTLCNSEVYGSGNIDVALNVPAWCEYVQKKYGFLPVKGLFNETGIRRSKDFKAPEQGIYEDDELATRTYRELVPNAQGPMLVNEINREVIRKLSPKNIVWSEPLVPYGVDMTASWEYDYNTNFVLYGLKNGSRCATDENCLYMPTVTMWTDEKGLFPLPEEKEDPLKNIRADNDQLPEMEDPARIEKKTARPRTVPIDITQTDDELIIKTYLALGAVRADALSFFSACSWPKGVENAGLKTPPPNKPYAIPGTGEKYAKAMHGTFHALAALLKDVPCGKNTVALYISDSSLANAQMWWTYWHFNRAFQANFVKCKLDFDILTDKSTQEEFRSYKHIFFPAARAVTRSNYNKLLATKDSSTIWVDRLCRQTYPNARRYDDPDDEKKYADTLQKTVRAIRESLKNELDIYAEGEVPDSVFTAKRISGGTPYYLVVNDARTSGPMCKFTADRKWRLPYGKAQKVTVRMRIPEKSVIYDFVTSKEIPFRYADGRAELVLDMEPAQGMLLCVYPAKFKELTLEKPASLQPGKNVLRVTLTDESGKQPAGRQLVQAVFTSNGTARDESGIYVLHNGTAEIPLYLRKASDADGLMIELTERTSGLQKVIR